MLSIRIVSFNKTPHLINAVTSILHSQLDIPFEILVFEGGDDIQNQAKFMIHMGGNQDGSFCRDNRISYFCNMGNFGLAKGLNFLHTQSSKETKYIVELNEDMFFHPMALQNLVKACRFCANIGLFSSQMQNGSFYPQMEPQLSHIADFADRNKSLPEFKLGLGASNLPWCMSIDFYNQLRMVDVWNDTQPLPFNAYPGIWDESIDHRAGWVADWCVHNRARSIKEVAIVENALVYHYDHCSGNELDKANPTWTHTPVSNYVIKWGKFEKNIVAPGLGIKQQPFPIGRYPQV
jgi:GT2 family glycosyltransferase